MSSHFVDEETEAPRAYASRWIRVGAGGGRGTDKHRSS